MKLGPMEMVIILVIVLLVFGPGKLPDVAASIGKSLKAFRQGQSAESEAKDESTKKVKSAGRTRKSKAAKEKTGETSEPAPVDTAVAPRDK
jgi:sec-independent protein translocase protein TatA